MTSRICLFFILLSLCGGGRAQQPCPWLTVGTAEALLGETATVSVHGSSHQGDCEFHLGRADSHNSEGMLKILVGAQPFKECAAGDHLTGIGQDSMHCEMKDSAEHVEAVRGRVRSSYFLITLRRKITSQRTEVAFRQSLEQIAEEVAGNLF